MGKRLKKVSSKIGGFFSKITAPVRNTKAWKFLRRWILRSPFRGYFLNSVRELKQVRWPDRKTSWRLTFTVIAFSAVFAVITTSLDFGFERLAKQIFLK